MQEKYQEIKGLKFAIENTSTGKYICDEKGDTKTFYSVDEAKCYIRHHKLTSIFAIREIN